MRAVLCGVLALVAVVAGTASVLLVLTGAVVADPDRPGRLGALALSSPVVRDQATDYLVDSFAQQAPAVGLEQSQVRRAAERAVDDARVREALAEAEVTPDGRLRLDGVYDALADQLEDAGRPEEARQVRQLPRRAVDSGPVADELTDVVRTARLALWGAALVAGIVSLVAGSLALAAARRRLLCFGLMVVGVGALAGLVLELMPRLAGDTGTRDVGWLGAARGLDEALGQPGLLTVVAFLAVGLVLAVAGLRSRPQ
ncbi:hypothetical protein [Nocardioides sp. CFH 31398]|uniref:hypothetical protein n=1 Tax=Nocardioides sp. CFH 31398 TaxID=2919579 RepID=UPI001F05D3EF|nr:hypothetical protein [Nocardioides sp. CFH 31398]MCH1868863.1 hypothetical protein [Nocardioides sp. CFH 31398]